ncbi:MAG: CapA family protein, partial [Myxococcota bacterium]
MMLRLVFPLLALCGARAEAQPTLWVTGDAMTSAQIRDAAVDASSPEAGIASMLEPLSELWSGARNVVIANLETPDTRRRRRAHDDGAPMRGLRAVRLNAPPYFLAGLRRSGVDALTLANNHALDQDEAGLAETLARVRASGLVPLGAGPGARAPLVVGGAVAVRVHNRYLAPGGTALEGALAYGGNEAPFGDGLDLVIVHVVGEREREVDERWRAYAETLVGAGADALIFHGTHVPLGA